MADEQTDDDENFAILTGLFSTDKGKTWLTGFLKDMGLELKTPAQPDPKTSPLSADPFAGFLERELSGAKAENSSLREKLDKLLDVLTPEQRTLLRSAPGAVEGGRKAPKQAAAEPIPPKKPGLFRL